MGIIAAAATAAYRSGLSLSVGTLCMSAPPAAAPFSLDLADGRLCGLRWGRPGARPVLALHGWLDNAASFTPLALALLEQCDIDLLAIDLAGHGHSDWLPGGYSQPAQAAQLLGLLDTLGWRQVELIGHSMGASIAGLLAAALPERVTRLVCIDALGPLSAPPEQSVTRLREYLLGQQPGQQRQPRPLPDPEHALRLRMQTNALSRRNAGLLVERGLRQDGHQWRWRTDPLLTHASAFYLHESQVQALLAAIQCPTLLLQAEPPGRFIAPQLQQQRQACIGGLQAIGLAGGHHLHMENAAACAAAIIAFINKDELKQ